MIDIDPGTVKAMLYLEESITHQEKYSITKLLMSSFLTQSVGLS